MCLLTFMDENKELPYVNAREAAKQNPDGFGFAIHAGTELIIDKDMDFEELWKRWQIAREKYRSYALWHFRIGTHGQINLNNCHPFLIDNNQTIVAHNGILPITLPYKDNRSDTNIFANIIIPKLGGVEYLNNNENCDALEKWALGSKLVFFSVDPKSNWDYQIMNMNSGHWDEGVWYSNSSYIPWGYRTYAPGPYRTPYLGWDDDEYYDGYGSWNKSTQTIEPDADKQTALGYPATYSSIDDDEIIDIMEELYQDSRWVNNILSFTSLDGYQPALIECDECGNITYTDPLDPSPTHCGICYGCLLCGTVQMCKCWEHYPYHQAYTDNIQNRNCFNIQEEINDTQKIETES